MAREDGIRTTWHGAGVVERWQDCESIIENNKRLQTEAQDLNSSYHHVCSIPNILYEKWFNEEYQRGNVNLKLFGDEMDKIVKRKLADPDYRWLRTDGMICKSHQVKPIPGLKWQ